MKAKNYSLLIVSAIPVEVRGNEYFSLDLWCKDINVNSKEVNELGLLCPRSFKDKKSLAKIEADIQVYLLRSNLDLATIKATVRRYEVIQLGAGRPFWHCFSEIMALIYAKKYKKKVIFSISSNRVKLVRLNSKSKPIYNRIKATLIARTIYWTQKFFSKFSDGVILVGSGLKENLGVRNKNIHIGLASWVSDEDILSVDVVQKRVLSLPGGGPPRLCICTRLEKMKGVHIAIKALATLKNKYDLCPKLSIYGRGPERENLEDLVDDLMLGDQVEFLGVVSYGEDFFKEIRKYDLMLLTNLSDEQPRLIFDALSQGVLPVCPRTLVYSSVGLNDKLLYEQGSSVDLARVIETYKDKTLMFEMIKLSMLLLCDATIKQMHINRVKWIKGLL